MTTTNASRVSDYLALEGQVVKARMFAGTAYVGRLTHVGKDTIVLMRGDGPLILTHRKVADLEPVAQCTLCAADVKHTHGSPT